MCKVIDNLDKFHDLVHLMATQIADRPERQEHTRSLAKEFEAFVNMDSENRTMGTLTLVVNDLVRHLVEDAEKDGIFAAADAERAADELAHGGSKDMKVIHIHAETLEDGLKQIATEITKATGVDLQQKVGGSKAN